MVKNMQLDKKSGSSREGARRESGFTLIELSIVLVIIGLIVGGVLVGQDLIKAAEIRATIAQIEKYSTAVNTFRSKYNGLPGDISNAAQFGLEATGATGAKGLANGNGLIESDGTTGVNGLSGESAIFWRHLAQANLVGEGITTADYTAGTITAINDTAIPLAKMGKNNRIHVTSGGGLNYFVMAGFTGAVTATTAAFGTAPADSLTPIEMFQIDTKMDDGKANNGTVRAVTVAAGATSIAAAGEASATDAGASTPAAGDCWDSDDGNYATATSTTSNVLGCQARLRSSF